MKVTIHQPDFLPWLGFFNKIAKSDIWVVLDHVENNPRRGGWFKRSKILVNGEQNWINVPISKSINHNIGVPINQMKINLNLENNSIKTLKKIEMAYKAAPYFFEHIDLVKDYFENKSEYLIDRNMLFINKIMELLCINTKLIYSSSLNLNTKSNQLLIDILHKVNGDNYICGMGSSTYQNDELFFNAGIDVTYNDFKYIEYKQLISKRFYPGLSIIDSLFMVNINLLKDWVHNI